MFPHGLFSKSPTNNERYNSDSKSDNPEFDSGSQDVALHDSFRPRHKYKANGRQTRFQRSETEGKTPQCAVMYKDNEPVGILQDSYKFLPVSGESTLVDINPIPVKRKSIMDVLYPSKIDEDYNQEELVENTNQFSDDRYPSIFAKFKIDSRLDKTLNPDLNLKRSMFKRNEKPDISDEQVSSLKTTLSKMKEDNSAVVEEELKSILDDMGLIDDYDESKEEAKREISEDENMEQGTNKINLIKEVHNETRNKRGDGNTTETASTTAVEAPKKVQYEEGQGDEIETIDLFKSDEAKLNELTTEFEDSRMKRQFDNKRDAEDTLPELNTSSLVKETELNQYEKRVEREIRDKILKLKEEVKEEIKNLKVDPKETKDESDSRRRKRQVVSTLVDEENQNIDPVFNDVQVNGKGHVRRKRSLEEIDEAADKPSDVVKGFDGTIDESKGGLRFMVDLGELDRLTAEVVTPNLLSNSTTFEGRKIVTEVSSGLLRETASMPFQVVKNGTENNLVRQPTNTNVTDFLTFPKQNDSYGAVLASSNSFATVQKKKNMVSLLKAIGTRSSSYNTDSGSVPKPPSKRMNQTNKALSKIFKSQPFRRSTATNSSSKRNTEELQTTFDAAANLSLPSSKKNNAADLSRIKELIDFPEVVRVRRFINPVVESANSTFSYRSRNIKQFDEGPNEEKPENDVHVRVKRSQKLGSVAKSQVHGRRKRNYRNDVEENAYEYDNGVAGENEAYEDNAFADNAGVDSIATNSKTCNCNKAGSGCKCGTQKADLTVPSFNEEYSDYPRSNFVEKKSASHCNCDKNGKNCKCQTVDEGPQRYEDESKNSDVTEDYYDDFETGGAKIMKREAGTGEKQPFHNGEYFVDLHPDVYKLTPLETPREKRESKLDGNALVNHVVAVKQRSMLPHLRRRRRIETGEVEERAPRQLIDMSDEDLFGALPQGFAGELARYKRVKRDKA
ncbi:hypothetical protein NQ315_009813 [Exocentrus adspersus]|uniref:Uncharacterized protein n=1 Tax=Exocentrus adspersus TaxID=1586481 RepID=A0AAV8WGR7_9CUCU|nr:hypothetical protein NQ315_009813 [Exocentrus adspersus]